MTAYISKIAKFAEAGNRGNTYDDKESRIVMKDHFAKIFPDWDIVEAGSKDKFDLVAYEKNSSKIVCLFELDHSVNRDWQYPTWGYYSILERKEKSMTELNKKIPVVMIWINQSMTKYIALNLRGVNIFDYPLQSISYVKPENRKNLKHPGDFHRRIPLCVNPVYEIGKEI